EQSRCQISVHCFCNVRSLLQVVPKRGSTKYSNPDACNCRRNDHDTQYEFADGAASRYAGNKSADKWGPSNCPGPIENGPAQNPIAALIWLKAQAILDEICDVVADCQRKRF